MSDYSINITHVGYTPTWQIWHKNILIAVFGQTCNGIIGNLPVLWAEFFTSFPTPPIAVVKQIRGILDRMPNPLYVVADNPDLCRVFGFSPTPNSSLWVRERILGKEVTWH